MSRFRLQSKLWVFTATGALLATAWTSAPGCNMSPAQSAECLALQADFIRVNGEIESAGGELTDETFCEFGQVLLDVVDAGCAPTADIPPEFDLLTLEEEVTTFCVDGEPINGAA